MRKLIYLVMCLVSVAFVASCGGGGGGGAAATSATGPATLGVLVTDATSEDYDEAIATITEIFLLCEKGQQEIFKGSITIDLLQLRDHLDLLAIADDVEPDVCSKIRLKLASLVLVKRKDDGSIEEEIEVDLVANGKIDLNPREKFIIKPAQKLLMTLDFDVDKSLKIMETGNGKIKIRPVIFVEISDKPTMKKGLTRVFGRIDEIATDLSGFKLCRRAMVAAPLAFDQTGPMPERCVKVALKDTTGIFGEDGEPIEASELMAEDLVTVIGKLRVIRDSEAPMPFAYSHSDSDTDSDSDSDSDSDTDSDSDSDPRPGLVFIVDAAAVLKGDQGTFSRIRGELLSEVNLQDGTYELSATDSPMGPSRLLDGQLYPKTQIFTFKGRKLDPSELKVGDKVLVDGVVIPADSADTNPTLRSAFMLVKPFDGTEPPEEVLVGKVKTVDLDNQSLMVATDTGDRCVLADEALVLFVVEVEDTDNPGQMKVEVIKGTLADLPENALIVIFGKEDVGGCFDADAIVSRGPPKNPDPGTEPT